jgi:hypothetical protein
VGHEAARVGGVPHTPRLLTVAATAAARVSLILISISANISHAILVSPFSSSLNEIDSREKQRHGLNAAHDQHSRKRSRWGTRQQESVGTPHSSTVDCGSYSGSEGEPGSGWHEEKAGR